MSGWNVCLKTISLFLSNKGSLTTFHLIWFIDLTNWMFIVTTRALLASFFHPPPPFLTRHVENIPASKLDNSIELLLPMGWVVFSHLVALQPRHHRMVWGLTSLLTNICQTTTMAVKESSEMSRDSVNLPSNRKLCVKLHLLTKNQLRQRTPFRLPQHTSWGRNSSRWTPQSTACNLPPASRRSSPQRLLETCQGIPGLDGESLGPQATYCPVCWETCVRANKSNDHNQVKQDAYLKLLFPSKPPPWYPWRKMFCFCSKSRVLESTSIISLTRWLTTPIRQWSSGIGWTSITSLLAAAIVRLGWMTFANCCILAGLEPAFWYSAYLFFRLPKVRGLPGLMVLAPSQ